MLTPTKTNITVMVTDMDASIAFYTEVLGLTLAKRYDNHYAEIESPGVNIGLHPTTQKITIGKNLSIGLAVDNFEASLQILDTAQLVYTVEKDGWSRLAYFADPDGNPLYLIEAK